ncbi:(2Fe-2S)-binding protein [Variovorax paradoxus]|uniref:(2Fe-2S)-binding protein n=1 Tax=Variovorax paradoxus TaxID=34073 RepID=UPI001932D22D|nr:2Fe-2S iron-sulfur cluster binding domain-containing protein [Variovorax paradoxus]
MKVCVNGRSVELTNATSTKAAYALRHELGLCDVRIGCGEGYCGACTVLVDGKPTTSCDLPLWALEDKNITTVRGLGSPERPHAVQSAFVEEQAGQCGYCLSGILVTSAALLDTGRPLTEGEIRAALDRHLCRCGAHGRMVKAVLRAQATLREQA